VQEKRKNWCRKWLPLLLKSRAEKKKVPRGGGYEMICQTIPQKKRGDSKKGGKGLFLATAYPETVDPQQRGGLIGAIIKKRGGNFLSSRGGRTGDDPSGLRRGCSTSMKGGLGRGIHRQTEREGLAPTQNLWETL